LTGGLDLEPFNPDDAAQLLQSLVYTEQSTEDTAVAEAIGQKLGGLPLAVAQVAGAITRRDLSLSEFLEFYSEQSFRQAIFQGDELSKPLWAVFAFEALSPAASALLHVLCFFDSDSVSESIITDYITSLDLPSAKPATSGFPRAHLEYVEARTELTKSSLVRRHINSQKLTIHRLVQESAMTSIASQRSIEVFDTSLDILSKAWPLKFERRPDRWQLIEALLPHVYQCLSRYNEIRCLNIHKNYNNKFARLLHHAGW